MKLAKLISVIFFCLVVMTSCASRQTTAFRKFDTSQSESVAIDAKQRVILVTRKDESTKFCAEPSPDALAAIGASLAASGQYRGEVEATLQAAIAETARGFGVRNATIQLLRDGLYRLCEAHLNDAISEKEYNRMANKYEDIMVTLLAVEKLTSIADPIPGQNIVLNTHANVENSDLTSDTNVQDPTKDEENNDLVSDTDSQNPSNGEVTVRALSDNQIETISQTVERLVQMMFDYWKFTYAKGLGDSQYSGVGDSN